MSIVEQHWSSSFFINFLFIMPDKKKGPLIALLRKLEALSDFSNDNRSYLLGKHY